MLPKVNVDKLTETAHLEKDLGLDSLDTVEFVMAVEEEFTIQMSDENADKISTVADIINYLCQHPNATACEPLGDWVHQYMEPEVAARFQTEPKAH